MKSPEWLRPLISTTRRRVRQMSVEDMGRWVDVAGSEMSRAFAAYVRERNPQSLAEVERGLGILTAMVEELRERS